VKSVVKILGGNGDDMSRRSRETAIMHTLTSGMGGMGGRKTVEKLNVVKTAAERIKRSPALKKYVARKWNRSTAARMRSGEQGPYEQAWFRLRDAWWDALDSARKQVRKKRGTRHSKKR